MFYKVMDFVINMLTTRFEYDNEAPQTGVFKND